MAFHQYAIQIQIFIINHSFYCSECSESCTISLFANNVFSVEDCQHLSIDCSNRQGKNRVILLKKSLIESNFVVVLVIGRNDMGRNGDVTN